MLRRSDRDYEEGHVPVMCEPPDSPFQYIRLRISGDIIDSQYIKRFL